MALQWLALVSAIWLQAINGTNSNFPAYSSELKKLLSISQMQLNNLASASDAGKLFGWVSGLAAAYFPLWIVLCIGFLLALVGYGFQFLFLTGEIESLAYWQIFLLTVLAGNSICWINTVCYVTVIKSYPLDRQIAVGISTSYIGLSAKIYTDIVDVIPTKSPSDRAKAFLLVNAVVPGILCIALSPLMRSVEPKTSKRLTNGFFFMFLITILTGSFAVVTSLETVKAMMSKYAIVTGMWLLLALPVVVPIAESIREKVKGRCLIRVHDEAFNTKEVSLKSLENGQQTTETETGGACEVGALEMVKTLNFWLYYMVYFFGATLGLVYLNNLGQIAQSRGCEDASSLVSLSAAFGFFGRLLPSLLDFFFPRCKHMVTRAGAMGIMMVPLCASFFLLMSAKETALYISTAGIGVCTGAITSISVPATAELFGTKNFGVNHNILVSNIPVGSFLFGDLAALVYSRYAAATAGSSSATSVGDCSGQNCYHYTFIIWGALCGVGTVLALILHRRTTRTSCN